MHSHAKINIYSEIGQLEGVILHTPGSEIENMTPENVERALYSDILNLSVALKEYKQMSEVLSKITTTYQVGDLLSDILQNDKVRSNLISAICKNELVQRVEDYLMEMTNNQLSKHLLEGVLMKKNSLTNFLDKDRYILRPLHNFFYTRDASISMFDEVLISSMASQVRERESIIMEAIFDYHSNFSVKTNNPINSKYFSNQLSFEGGDVLIAREDVIIIGMGMRTSSQGIDYILEHLKKYKRTMHIIVQELPVSPESFIHLDMTFTFLDKDRCMVYEPLILNSNRYLTIHIKIDNGKVTIRETENIIETLRKLNFDIKPILCGGGVDSYIQDREQWHSAANFFALAPGKVIGYERNVYTIDELSRNGFEIVKAKEIIDGTKNYDDYSKLVITIEGSELSRGGGGCRCMTMPVSRQKVDW